MATGVNEPVCASCNSERGAFQCRGCSKVFCFQHTTNHHQSIIQELDAIEHSRNLLQSTFQQTMAESLPNAKALHEELTKKIDMWEEASVEKIRKAAADARNDLFQLTINRGTKIQSKLEELTQQIQHARQKSNFLETDVREWTKKLEDLKEQLIKVPAVTVCEDYTKLISKISVSGFHGSEIFGQSTGNAGFEDNGKVVYVKNGNDLYTEVRGQCEYSSGLHTIFLRVEEYAHWILFGIISKSTPLQIHSYASPSCYGWYNGVDFVYAAGVCIGGQGIDVIANDRVQLTIDCDNRLIRLINKRSGRTLELAVDIEKCPFPWQLHLNLNAQPTRVRIVSSDE
ncbi:unnamed protein product [Adineta ricciae]|uniref:B box-type domain-containing protein n=1 Tax=Adineta ricciae TaxID=249248 RepID=A0A815P683_ADIRI|nr:unnamed protein product [Adineta ricciae]CAF1444758.1 unnamed protein product [Adineta ricciae]